MKNHPLFLDCEYTWVSTFLPHFVVGLLMTGIVAIISICIFKIIIATGKFLYTWSKLVCHSWQTNKNELFTNIPLLQTMVSLTIVSIAYYLIFIKSILNFLLAKYTINILILLFIALSITAVFLGIIIYKLKKRPDWFFIKNIFIPCLLSLLLVRNIEDISLIILFMEGESSSGEPGGSQRKGPIFGTGAGDDDDSDKSSKKRKISQNSDKPSKKRKIYEDDSSKLSKRKLDGSESESDRPIKKIKSLSDKPKNSLTNRSDSSPAVPSSNNSNQLSVVPVNMTPARVREILDHAADSRVTQRVVSDYFNGINRSVQISSRDVDIGITRRVVSDYFDGINRERQVFIRRIGHQLTAQQIFVDVPQFFLEIRTYTPNDLSHITDMTSNRLLDLLNGRTDVDESMLPYRLSAHMHIFPGQRAFYDIMRALIRDDPDVLRDCIDQEMVYYGIYRHYSSEIYMNLLHNALERMLNDQPGLALIEAVSNLPDGEFKVMALKRIYRDYP